MLRGEWLRRCRHISHRALNDLKMIEGLDDIGISEPPGYLTRGSTPQKWDLEVKE